MTYPETLDHLRPGDIGFSTIPGRVGALVRIGQRMLRGDCKYTHAFLCIGNGLLIEAMPKGARIVRLDGRGMTARDANAPWRWEQGYAYCRLNMTDEKRREIMRVAPGFKGTPYSFADYLALFLKGPTRPKTAADPAGGVFGANWKRPVYTRAPTWLDRYVTDSGHMICSQLVDHILAVAGVHLFDDGRLHQDVTPADLYFQCEKLGIMVYPVGTHGGVDVRYPEQNSELG